MSQQTVTKCDGKGCEKVKGEANKWIRAYLRYEQSSDCTRVDPVFIAFGLPSFDLHVSRVDYVTEDFCSDACLQKRIGEVLNAIRNVPHEEPVK